MLLVARPYSGSGTHMKSSAGDLRTGSPPSSGQQLMFEHELSSKLSSRPNLTSLLMEQEPAIPASGDLHSVSAPSK